MLLKGLYIKYVAVGMGERVEGLSEGHEIF